MRIGIAGKRRPCLMPYRRGMKTRQFEGAMRRFLVGTPVPTAPVTRHQVLPPIPDTSGAVGLQTPLVGPEALGRDVGWAAAVEQDQALLGRAHGPSRSRTAAHLT